MHISSDPRAKEWMNGRNSSNADRGKFIKCQQKLRKLKMEKVELEAMKMYRMTKKYLPPNTFNFPKKSESMFLFLLYDNYYLSIIIIIIIIHSNIKNTFFNCGRQ